MTDFSSILEGDPHDARRLANVHPASWVNPVPAPRYNLVVVGAGSAGLITSLIAASLGAKVALVERELLGGDCLNVGCVPSKGLIRASRMAAEVAEASRLGLDLAPGARIDFARAMARMREVRARISHEDAARRYRDEFGVDVFLGAGRFLDDERLRVGEETLRFKKAVIATGARAVVPDIPGLRDVAPLTNETVFNLTSLPRRLAIIGGGPIGCELAQSFRRLGSEVTILEQAAQFLVREDVDAAALLKSVFDREGIVCELGVVVERARLSGSSKVVVFRRPDASVHELEVDEILVGAGRQPNVENLGLETVGVDFDPRDGVKVDDHLRTSNPRFYAAGDVCMKWKFTHAADAAAKVVVQNALFFGRKKLSKLVMPWCTYTSPEIAHVGLYPREAQERGIAITTYQVPLSQVNRAVTDGEEEGFAKIHVRAGTDRILGATIVASHAGDLISQVTQAMVAGVGLGTIGNVIFPYPTQAEVLKRVAGLATRERLTPALKRLFAAWLAWSR